MQPAAQITRKLRLTDEGLRYYERLCTPLAEIEQATGGSGRGDGHQRPIRLAAPIALSNTILVDMLADFGLRYPGCSSTSARPMTMPPLRSGQGPGLLQRRALPDPAQCPLPGPHRVRPLRLPSISRRRGYPPIRPSWKSTTSFTAGPISVLAVERTGRADGLHQAPSPPLHRPDPGRGAGGPAPPRHRQRPQHYVHPFPLQDAQLVLCCRTGNRGSVPSTCSIASPSSPRCVLRCSPISSRNIPHAIAPIGGTINFTGAAAARCI